MSRRPPAYGPVGVFLALLAVGAALAVYWPRIWGALDDPKTEIITQLKRTERDGLTLEIPGAGAPLVSQEHHFDRITVSLEAGGKKAEAVSTLDLTGMLGETKVSSLGLERTPFVRQGDDWKPAGSQAPLLTAAVAALVAREAALTAGDAAALGALLVPADRARALRDPDLAKLLGVSHRRYQSRVWYLRSERGAVVVGEEYRFEGELPNRPVDEEGRRRLFLVRDGDRFLFRGGLL